MLTTDEHEARQQRFARILIEEAEKLMKAAAASTPAGRGANNTGSRESGTSLATNKPEVAAVVPPTPDETPAAAGADEIWRISAVDHSPRLILGASSSGRLTIGRAGAMTLYLSARETAELHDFLDSTATIRGQA